MDSPEITAAKHDGEFLYRVLGVKGQGNHQQCPICKKKNMRCGPDKDGSGAFLFQCMSGCGTGSVIDALMLVEGRDQKSAMEEAAKPYRTGGAPARQWQRPVKPQDHNGAEPEKKERPREAPVLDMDKAEAFIKRAHEHLLDNLDIVSHFKRGLSEEVIVKHRIGFIENVPLKWHPGPGPGWNIPAGWVLPIDDDEAVLKGVKLHFEIRPTKADGSPCDAKAMWAPFGTMPPHDKVKGITPNHSYYTMWPHPDTLVRPNPVIATDRGWWLARIPPGDLKRRWDEQFEWQKLQVALNLSKTADALTGEDAYTAEEWAWDQMRDEIMRVVCQLEAKNPAKQDNEDVDWSEYVFITPGELKALAIESAGFMATAITGGESWIPPPDLLDSFAGLRTVILYDDDPPRRDTRGFIRSPGATFARNLGAALRRHGATEATLMRGGSRAKATP